MRFSRTLGLSKTKILFCTRWLHWNYAMQLMAPSRQATFPAIQMPIPAHAAAQTVFVSATFIVSTLTGPTSRGPVLTKNGALFQIQFVPAIRVRDHVSMYRWLTNASLRGAPGYVGEAPLDYLDSVTFCSDGSVCCGFANTECCNAGLGHAQIIYGQTAVIPSGTGTVLSSYYSGVHVSTLPITRTSSTPLSQTSGSQMTQASPSSSSSSFGGMPLSQTSSTQMTQASSSSSSFGGLSQGAKIGLGVGTAVGALLLIAITGTLTYLYVKRKHRYAQHENVAPHKDEQQLVYELPRNTTRQELDSIPMAVEMNVE
jgi:hypothetical protein